MNVGRFHAAVYAIRQEIEKDKNIQRLTDLQAVLQNSISQQTPESAVLFKNSYADLIKTFDDADSNYAYPTRRMIFEEIGAFQFIGSGLSDTIKAIISDNQISPANALSEIQEITNKVNEFYNRIVQLDTVFTDLGIEFDNLEDGEFEIGFSFPHEVAGTDIESLEKEFRKMGFALKTLQEIATGDVGKIEIKTISASEWQIFLDSIPPLAACTAVAIERIVTLYKSNLEIKLLKQQLDEKKLPEEVTKPLQDHIETTVKIELRVIADELVDEFYLKDDEGRKNELKNQASQALLYLADRIDNGATIEARANPPKKPESETSENEEEQTISPEAIKQYEQLKAIADKVNSASSHTFNLQHSSAPVLSLKYDEEDKDKI